MKGSFYWHDYETFGSDPSRDRPVQFAGLRTDLELNVISEPLVVFCQPARDVLPQPQACLVHGITPQQALREGVCEAEFTALIHQQLALPGTCGVGYNNIDFDDEVTRHILYRNFYDPYEREYKHGNSRWDIINLLRLAQALRPESLVWPRRADGHPSFRLEDLAPANGIEHQAHDASADTRATLALARLLRQRQPRMFDYVLAQRNRSAVLKQLDISAMKPVLHVSPKFGAARSNIGLVAPVARHPDNRNEIICVDLSRDPTELADLSAARIGERLFCPRAELAAGTERPAIKNIRINRCPVVVTPRLLDDAAAERLNIDLAAQRDHATRLKTLPGLADKLQQVHAGRQFPSPRHPDQMLYSGSFFGPADSRARDWVRSANPDQLREEPPGFADPRLPDMLFYYRARNYPRSLTEAEQVRWEEVRYQYLTDPAAGAGLCLEEYLAIIEQLQREPASTPGDRDVLNALQDYSDLLLA